MIGQNSHQRKQIAPGITLIKFIPNEAVNKDMYVFEVEVERLNIVEFECDFTGSENISIKDVSGLKCIKTIEPFKRSLVAVLELHKDWKLKSKFRFTLKSPSKEMQTKWVETENKTIKSYIINAEAIFKGTEPSLMTIEEINALVEKANTKYLDLQFVPDEISVIGNQDRTLMDSTVTQWRRPDKFLKSPYDLISRIHPNNLQIGKLDNQAFFSVLRALSTRPPLIERLFLSPMQINPHGVYRLRICKNGEWQSVTIDDSIPCQPISHPKFTRSLENDLWPMLIEKAYAKLHRSYFSLRELQVKDVFEDLTGCPTQVIPIEDSAQFKDAIAQGFGSSFMVCFYNVDQIKQFEQDEFTPISKRAYPLTKLNESLNEIHIISDNGQIPLTFAELKQKFSYAVICETKNWEDVRVKGKFITVEHPYRKDYRMPISRWYYTFDLHLHTEVLFTIHQEDIHVGCNKEFKQYLWVSLVVLRKTAQAGLKAVGFLPFTNTRQANLRLQLELGSYLAIPITLTDLTATDKMDETQLVYDTFQKLDLLMNRQLKYAQLVPFFKAVKHPFNHEQYLELLKKYSRSKSIGLNGFTRMWKDKRSVWLPEIQEFSENRLFVFSMHCQHELSLLVKDNVGTDFDNLAHIEVITRFGKEKQFGKGKEAKIYYLKHGYSIMERRNSYITYYVENDHVGKLEIELDCSPSQGYLFNPPSGKAVRQLDSGQREYVMKMLPNLSGDLNFVQRETVNIRPVT